jgi:hypothetical protein
VKVVGIVILAAIALAILTGSCGGGEFFTFHGDFFPSTSGATSTSALTSNQLPPPTPPSAAIHRATKPAAWTEQFCGAVKGWETDWKARAHVLDESLAGVDSLDQTRNLYVDFWGESVTKTDRLLHELDAAGHPAVRGGEGIARAYRLIFAKTFPPTEMARAVAVALPDDPARFSEGLAEIRSNMARVFAVRDDELVALHDKLNKTLPSELRKAINENPVCRTI